MTKDDTSIQLRSVSSYPSAQRRIFISLFLIGMTLIASCSKEVAESESKGSTPERLKELVRIRNSGTIGEEADYQIITSSLERGSNAERAIALSIIGKHPDQGCFAVNPLIRLLESEPDSSARLSAIRVLGKLGACAKPAQDVLKSIAAESSFTESKIAELSLQKIRAANQ